MNNPNLKAQELFLLMFNISQITNGEKIIDFFINALADIWPETKIAFHLLKPQDKHKIIEISLSNRLYGFIQIDRFDELETEEQNLFQNAVGMLAIILNKNEKDKLLEDEKLRLLKLVDEKIYSIKESEERYRSLFENMLNGFAYCQMLYENGKPIDFIYLDVNMKFESLTGLRNVVGKKVTEVIPGIRESDNKLFDIYSRVALSGNPETFEMNVQSLNDWYSITVYSPKKEYFIAVFDVITERKHAGEALRRSEQLYRAIGESIDYGVWVCDPEGRNIYTSESFLKMVGLTQEQCSNFGWGDVLHPDDSEHTIAAWKECVRTGNNWDIEHRFRGVDGQWHYVLARGVPVRDENGQITSWAGINLDVTERKRIDEELIKSVDLFSKAFHGSPSPITIASQKDGTYIAVNDSFLRLVEFAREDVIGKNGTELGLMDEAGYDKLKSVLNGKGALHNIEVQAKSKSGKNLHLLTSCENAEINGEACTITTMLDITEHKLAEDKLKESEEKYRLLLENSGIGVGVYSLDGKIILLNQKAIQNLGGKREDYIGKSLLDVFGEQLGAEYMSRIQLAANSENAIEFEDFVQFPTRDFWFLSNHTRIINSKGQVIGVQVIANDISEHKFAEEKVRKIGKHYQALIENAPDGIALITPGGKFSFISPSAKRMFGYDASETTTDDPNKNTHPDDLPYVLSVFDKIIQEPDYVPTIQYRFSDKEGNWKWIESTFTNLFSDSNVNAIVINFRDINDRKTAEEKLLLSEEKYRLIADNTDDWIYWIKPDGNFQYISPSCEKMTGYSAQEFMENPQLLEEIYYSDDRDIVLAHKHDQTNIHPSDNMEFRIVTKNGETIWIQHSCSSIYNQQGGYAGRRGTNRNITKRREAEDKEHMALQRLRHFVDSSIVGIVIASADGKIIEANDYYLNMLGYTRQEYESGMLDWRSITPPELLYVDEIAIKELRERGICAPYEKQYIHRNGEQIFVLTAVAILPGPEEQIAAFVIDITGRKQMESDLLKNNSRLELAMYAANMAWWEMELPSGDVLFNKKKAEMLGYPPENFKHYTDFMALVHPEDAEKAMDAMRDHMYGKAENYEIEYRILTHSGEYKWFYDLGSVAKKDSDGKPLLVTGLVLDISKRKMAEEKILSQLSELLRWQKVIQGREDRSRELKREVNELLVQMGKPIRYSSQKSDEN